MDVKTEKARNGYNFRLTGSDFEALCAYRAHMTRKHGFDISLKQAAQSLFQAALKASEARPNGGGSERVDA